MLDEGKAADIYGHGWAYYLGDKRPAEFAPGLHQEPELVEWMKGFAAAMADYDPGPTRTHPSIQAALVDLGIDGDLLEDCLKAAEQAVAGGEWCRWPSVHVRGLGDAKAAIDKTRSDLPRIFGASWINEAYNDEVG
jgi:hypothetical protein